MYFKPIDEMSLRQLFSSCLGEETLKMEYLGPVLNSAGKIQANPDCLILDRRKERYEVKRCEFKFAPSCKEDFSHNGQFDIAIIWKISAPLTKQRLNDELLRQNGCHEVIILSEDSAFNNLNEYRIMNSKEFNNANIEELEEILLRVEIPTVAAAYIAAKISPQTFDIEKMMTFLLTKYPEVQQMLPQGRGNVVGKLLQTRMPLLKKLRAGTYCWDETINAEIASVQIEKIIRINFRADVPNPENIRAVHH